MKKIFLLAFVIQCYNLFPQLALKASYIRPTSNFGMTMKPAMGAELVYKPFEEESGFSFRASLGFAKFKPRLDTFPIVGTISGSGYTVTPGYMVYHKYNLITLNFGGDYMIFVNDKFCLYPGIDLGVLLTSVAYESYAPLISDEGYSGGYTFFNTRLRLGAEYYVTPDVGIFAEFTRSMNFSPDVGVLGYNDYGIGIHLNF